MTTTQQTLEQRLAALEAKNQALEAQLAQASKTNKLRFKVSEKGAISVTGLGQWPTTLYRGQWDRLLAQADELKTFISSQEAVLKTLGTWTKQ
jgi:hypothetical protein